MVAPIPIAETAPVLTKAAVPLNMFPDNKEIIPIPIPSATACWVFKSDTRPLLLYKVLKGSLGSPYFPCNHSSDPSPLPPGLPGHALVIGFPMFEVFFHKLILVLKIYWDSKVKLVIEQPFLIDFS